VLSVTFTPTDTTDYNSVTAIVTLTVNSAQSGQETPDISWLTPAAISYGTALSSTQLNASASYNGTVVPGTFEYTPAAGEVLDSGSQTLLVAFFPNDSTTYSTAGGSVQLQVIPSASDLPQTFYYYCIPDPSNNYCSSFGYNSAGPGYDGAGNLKYSIDLVTGSWSFNYDTLNRLIAGMPAPGSSANNGNNLCWSYDPFGNRTAQSSQNTPCPTLPSTPTQTVYYNTNNQITGGLVTYDAAGDVAMDTNAGNTYLYDGEGRICAVMSEPVPNNSTMTAYVYDAEGNRVAKGVISSWPTNGLCPNLAAAGVFTPTASYVLGPSNEQLTETDGQGQWQHTNVYAAGTIIATYDQVSNPLYTNGGTQPAKVPALHFQLEDWLGSRRVQTNITGTVEEWYVSLPYGDGLTPIPNLGCLPSNNCYSEDPTEHHFTGKERDAETGFANGNDYFGARYYASSMGRWMSPDWSAKVEPVPYSKLDDPQTLNLYAYVGNNPLTRVDPDGHTEPIRFGCSEGQKDCNTDQQKAQQQSASGSGNTLPTGTDLTKVQTLMGEQTNEALVGSNQYADDESGRKVGPPGGAVITDATLDKEANLMAGTMLNLGHIGNDKTYVGLPAGKRLTALAAKAKAGSPLSIQLQRDISAVRNATPSAYSQWRSVNQGFIRSRGDALRVAGTDFIP
jgi:RHS repeat-associated protein